MPNWCQNEVSVFSENKKTLKKFIEYVESKESEFDFDKIYPMPKELEGTVSGSESLKSDEQKAKSELWKIEYGADNWYDWKRINWGTKWNACDVTKYADDEYQVEYRFDTAWCPPIGILETLQRVFNFNSEDSDINIQWFYREDGMAFSGYLDQELDIDAPKHGDDDE